MPYDPSNDIGKVRLKITDKTEPFHFTDDELQIFLDEAGSINVASATALETWASEIGRKEQNEKIGDHQLDTKGRAAAMLKTADALRAIDEESPAFGIAEQNLSQANETDIVLNHFARTLGDE